MREHGSQGESLTQWAACMHACGVRCCVQAQRGQGLRTNVAHKWCAATHQQNLGLLVGVDGAEHVPDGRQLGRGDALQGAGAHLPEGHRREQALHLLRAQRACSSAQCRHVPSYLMASACALPAICWPEGTPGKLMRSSCSHAGAEEGGR